MSTDMATDTRLFWEDLRSGDSFRSGTYALSETEIISFARAFDPQPFHLDKAAAQKTLLKGLAASGWHSCAIMNRLLADGWLTRTHFLGMAGLAEVRWLAPVRPDHVVRCHGKVTACRPLAGHDQIGACDVFLEMRRADSDEVLMTWEATLYFRRRNSASTASPRDLMAQALAARQKETPFPVPDYAVRRNPDRHLVKFFDDIALWDEIDLWTYRFDRDRITRFSAAYDPTTSWLTPEDGPLLASGWHVAAAWMRQLVRYYARRSAEMRQMGLLVPQLGPSPGFRHLRWLAPVYEGDTISYRGWAVRKVDLKSRPQWGLLVTRNEGVNQRGDTVLTFDGQALLQRHT